MIENNAQIDAMLIAFPNSSLEIEPRETVVAGHLKTEEHYLDVFPKLKNIFGDAQILHLTEIRMSNIFETVSFHIVKPCDMKCKFCYATFEDIHVIQQLSLEDAKICIDKLVTAGVEKITFAGGEPLLYRHISEIIKYSHSLGVTTSIISNGSLMTKNWLFKMLPFLHWVGISVDSLNEETNIKIGRVSSKNHSTTELLRLICDLGYKLKINTVVNAFNWQEDLSPMLTTYKPDRWKVFQTLRVEGQNERQFEAIKATEDMFSSFLKRHEDYAPVAEDNEAMTGSYLLIDPKGRLFENSTGKHTYSDSLVSSSVEKCLSQISLNRSTFISRGGLYAW